MNAAMDFPKDLSLVVATGKTDEPGIEEEFRAISSRLGNLIWVNRMLSDGEKAMLYKMAEGFILAI